MNNKNPKDNMGLTKIKKGLSLPINGEPKQEISAGNDVKKVALLGEDYVGMKPTMAVQVGDSVKLGQLLFTDKKNPSVKYTSPGTGKVAEINRGEKRAFKSIVIELEGDDEITFNSFSESEIASLSKEKVVEQLLESGQWTALRKRPFSKVPNPEAIPHSIFITAMDTSPLAISIVEVLKGQEKNFENGIRVLSKLTEGKVFLCKEEGTTIPGENLSEVTVESFAGPHPAGNAGTHIHFLDPVNGKKEVWYIGAQDVAAIGHLFSTGKIMVERVVSLAGPSVKNPRLIKTRLGASLRELTTGELVSTKNRVISGSVICGRKLEEMERNLGRYHQTISVIPEDNERKFLGWLGAGGNIFTVTKAYLGGLLKNKKFNFSTNAYGQERAIVPIGNYEKVMPLDILPTFLLKSLAINDVEEAEKLGCLELDEEDLALCTLVCSSKIDHGLNLRKTLNIIEKEG